MSGLDHRDHFSMQRDPRRLVSKHSRIRPSDVRLTPSHFSHIRNCRGLSEIFDPSYHSVTFFRDPQTLKYRKEGKMLKGADMQERE
jgi:hypothetical protein